MPPRGTTRSRKYAARRVIPPVGNSAPTVVVAGVNSSHTSRAPSGPTRPAADAAASESLTFRAQTTVPAPRRKHRSAVL
ncbi:hypothetical protein DIPPA_17239 [Diplonema papillatum]|nr:hypothetical protein DIPPA_17239 [Diplonema papillatum]